MKESGVSHPVNEFHPYANGNMQHMYNNSRQTPDSGLGNEELRNSMNNAGGGENSGAPAGAGAPPGFQPNPYYVGNAQQPQYNEQQQPQFRHKQYSGGPQEGGRFERPSGPPSIVTMHTSPPNTDQEGAPSYNPNYGNYSQYGNQGGPPQYGGMDRNFNPPHQMAARSHSNFSESSSSTLNMASGGPPDASVLSGQPLMAAGPHGGMMYPPQGGPPMGPPYGHPQMQQQPGGGAAFMFNPAAAHAAAMASHAQMMQGGQMAQQQGGPQGIQHHQAIPPTVGGQMPPGPPQSTSPPQHPGPQHPGMMMVPMGQHGAPLQPSQTVYYQPHPSMMVQRGVMGPVVGASPDGFVQFPYPHAAAVAAQQQGGFVPMRAAMLEHQRSLNSPAPSDNTDVQSVHGSAPSIGMWNGPPDQQPSHPGGMQPMQQGQMMPMQPGMMNMQHQMMSASYPGGGGVPFGGPAPGGGPRMFNPTMMNPPITPQQQMALQHAMIQQHQHQQQQQGMQQMQPHPQQMQQQYNAGVFPPQPQSGYWQGPGSIQGTRGGFRGRGGRGGGAYGGGSYRPGSRQQYNSRNNSIASGGRGRETEENSKCTTPTEDEITDMSNQMDASLRMGEQSVDGGQAGHPGKQLLEQADTKSTSPPAEPHPSKDHHNEVGAHEQEGGAAAAATTMPTTPKHQTEKGSSQSIPVDPVPPQGVASPAGKKCTEVAAKLECVYCKGTLQLPVEEYTGHKVRNSEGIPTCPKLRMKGCTFCKENGDRAHDSFFCKERIKQAAGHSTAPASGHAPHAPHAAHGEREGGYRGKRGGHYSRGGRGAHGGERKYENRRAQ